MTDFDDYLVCPYCGEQDEEYTEYPNLERDGEEGEHNCAECGKDYVAIMCVTYTWASEKTKETP